MNTPPVGHLDPAFLALMDEIRAMCGRRKPADHCSIGYEQRMEATIANATEHDDVVLVGVSGYFGNRLVDMAGRYGADVRTRQNPGDKSSRWRNSGAH